MTVSGESQTGDIESEKTVSEAERIDDAVVEELPKPEIVVDEKPIEPKVEPQHEQQKHSVEKSETRKEEPRKHKREQEFTTPAERKMVTGGNTFWKHA